MQHETTEFIK